MVIYGDWGMVYDRFTHIRSIMMIYVQSVQPTNHNIKF